MKKLATLAAVAAALAVPAGAFADASGDGSGYGTQPGFLVALSHTECAGHGAFGAFGKDNNFAGGANGQLTGYYNSSLCGNGGGGTAP
ncbi:MAG: hypothetical protein E6G13_09285 [Actinobacteria bacterium]|nr:MAG: hypothetical protein E6G13_09285 [Actinomycetota bacterium]